MGGFEIQKNQYSKVSGIAEARLDKLEPNRLRAIVKVNVEGYVPDNVELRQRIDGEMFTAEFGSDLLDQLEKDEHVASVAVSERLNIIE